MKLNKLAEEAYAIAEARKKNGANVNTDSISMLKHCATEVVEATEAYVRLENTLCDNEEIDRMYGEYEKELADIICCVLIICGKEEIDISKAIKEVMEKNRLRARKLGDKL